MELKHEIYSFSRQTRNRLNRTLMELKLRRITDPAKAAEGLNRTLMELKRPYLRQDMPPRRS